MRQHMRPQRSWRTWRSARPGRGDWKCGSKSPKGHFRPGQHVLLLLHPCFYRLRWEVCRRRGTWDGSFIRYLVSSCHYMAFILKGVLMYITLIDVYFFTLETSG